MTHESTGEQPGDPPIGSSETMHEDSARGVVPPPPPGAADVTPLTVERVADITFGVASVAVEAAGAAVEHLSASAKSLQENAPAILNALEERGRPIREQLVTRLRDAFPLKETSDGSAATADADSASVSPANQPAEASSVSVAGPAGQEIEALEQRVRELELQISNPPAETLPAEVLEVTPSESAPPTETPAEEASYFAETAPVTSLADSEYAVSEPQSEENVADSEESGEEVTEAELPHHTQQEDGV